MLVPSRIDKNGLPVFDDPKENKLNKSCHESMHVWYRDYMREELIEWSPVDINGAVETTYTPIICGCCSKRDFEQSSIYFE